MITENGGFRGIVSRLNEVQRKTLVAEFRRTHVTVPSLLWPLDVHRFRGNAFVCEVRPAMTELTAKHGGCDWTAGILACNAVASAASRKIMIPGMRRTFRASHSCRQGCLRSSPLATTKSSSMKRLIYLLSFPNRSTLVTTTFSIFLSADRAIVCSDAGTTDEPQPSLSFA